MTAPDSSYADDPTIADDSSLWRRVPPRHFVLDENLGRMRPSSAAFEDHPNGTPMSVVLGEEVLNANRSPESVLSGGHEDYGLVSFTAGLARQKNQGIVRKPLREEPAHAEVFGKKTKSVKNAFAKNCQWVIPPPEPA